MSAAGARAEHALAPARLILENQFQPELHHSGVSRTDDWAARDEVWCAASTAKRVGNGGINETIPRTAIR